MTVRFDGFDWDQGNVRKIAEHGLSVELLEKFFHGKFQVAPDPRHSDRESRFLAVGRSFEDRPMFVVFAIRDKDGRRLVRPISARYMHAKEAKRYEEAFTKA